MANDSGTDLAQLEYEFATKPNSEAFIPLAEAYLKMGRFVEAMVVCKKGIKAHPELATGRMIMARIYSDQAKHQKAIEELNNLLKLNPGSIEAHRLLGTIHLKLGRDDQAIEFLKKTLDLDPDDQPAREELLKRGIDYTPVRQRPQPPPDIDTQPGATSSYEDIPLSERPTQRNLHPIAPADQVPTRRPVTPGLSDQPTQPAVPMVAQRPARPPRKRIADIYQELEAVEQKPKRKGIRFTFFLFGVLLAGLAVYVIYTWQAGLRQKEINKNLEQGHSRFNSDTYSQYVAALDNYRTIYKLDKAHPEALSRGAFICAVLVGEYRADRTLLDEGDKYIREAAALQQSSTMHIAAQALLAFYSGGSSNETVQLLEKALKDQPDSPLLHTTLGIVFLGKGDLSDAKEHLLKGAQQSETRALVGLGEYALRRSLYREASQFFNRGLQSDSSHIRSLLGLALVSLMRGTEKAYVDQAQKLLERFHKELENDASEMEKTQARFLDLVLKVRNRKMRKASLAEINAMLKKESGNALFHFVAARELRRYRMRKQAKELIQKALRIDSSRPDFVLEEAAIFLALKDYEAARARALRVQRMDAESGHSLLLAGDAYLGEKNWAKAREYYERCRTFDDVAGLSHMRLGDLFLNQPRSDRDLAQAEYEEAIRLLSSVGERRLAAESAVKAAKIYADKNRRREFIERIQQAIRIEPSYAPPYALLAGNLDLDDAEGRQTAKEYCTKYQELDPRGKYAEDCKKILKQIR